jgi:hypothetical protein
VADLFDHAAERAAIRSGRPVSQERQRALNVDAAPAGPLFDADATQAGWCRFFDLAIALMPPEVAPKPKRRR